MMNNIVTRATETETETNEATMTICPTTVNLLNAMHESYSPVQCKSAIAFKSGSRQVTEFTVNDEGFRVLTWEKRDDGTTFLASVLTAEPTAAKQWRALETLCLSGLARLSDRAPVRGVGRNPNFRERFRATDDVSAVVNWIRRSEQWFEKRTSQQRKEVLAANAALRHDANEATLAGEVDRLPGTKSWELESKENERTNRVFNGMVDLPPSLVQVGSVKHWDHEGALSVKGKRVSSGSTTKTCAGKRDRIVILRGMVDSAANRAEEAMKAGDMDAAEYYLEVATDAKAKADNLQGQLNARMAAARDARRVKREARIAISAKAAEALADEAAHAARMAAAMGEKDAPETAEAE